MQNEIIHDSSVNAKRSIISPNNSDNINNNKSMRHESVNEDDIKKSLTHINNKDNDVMSNDTPTDVVTVKENKDKLISNNNKNNKNRLSYISRNKKGISEI
jgi:hypothetical protein